MYTCSTFVAGKGVITEPKRVDFEVFGWILNGWMVGWLDGLDKFRKEICFAALPLDDSTKEHCLPSFRS